MNNTKSLESFKSGGSSYLGFNLGHFSITPIVRKQEIKTLINQRFEHHWTGIASGKPKDFFIIRKYGDTPPNSNTEDFLLILCAKAIERGSNEKIPCSATELQTIRGYSHYPGGDSLTAAFNHLDALQETTIHTNALYDRNAGEWYKFKGSPIGGFTYLGGDGRWQTRHYKDGTSRKTEVTKLGTASIPLEFWEAFLTDFIHFDLQTYFKVGSPIAKRIYRTGMKHILTVGDFEMDLVQCCITLFGMLPHKVLGRKPSEIKRDTKNAFLLAQETGHLLTAVEKSNTPSGYKAYFRKPVLQLSFSGFPGSLKGKEKTVCTELKKRKVNKKLAYDLVISARRYYGSKGSAYINWIIKEWDADNTVGPGVFKHRITSLVFRSRYDDILQKQRVRSHQREARLCAESGTQIGSLFGKEDEVLTRLKKANAEVFKSIVDAMEKAYSSAKMKQMGYGSLDKEKVDVMKFSAMRQYARKTLSEWKDGNTDYRPPLEL